MAIRIAGVILPNNKRIEIALMYLYGIGKTLSGKILDNLNIDKNIRTQNLTEDQTNKLREYIEKNFRVEGDLRRDIMANIKRYKEIGCYRGARHAKSLPVRGQRTKTNSRTVRGNKRQTMGSGRRKEGLKT